MGGSNKGIILNPPKTNNLYAKLDPFKYYRCNEERHRSNECSKRKAINIIEKCDDDDGEIYLEPDREDEEKDCEQDESVRLMRKSMFIQKIEDKSLKDFVEQRDHLEFEFNTFTMLFAVVNDEEFKKSILGKEEHQAMEFLEVLNSKKRKLRELRDQLSEKETSGKLPVEEEESSDKTKSFDEGNDDAKR
ncbi:hypothetical protein GH714_020765 [Hevea brasiliensis]|uniref:Uncharacterized protein n=1 Tax=Hevea brasiliensis TaxID=3981 RepID=A0A6A6MKY1_HEVBR|nr:hypothetical protein GH714_020765 [Hevea brasiliensis]